ncbi:MAG TPA: hypothetical protein DEZ08_07585 [Dehalococcoidia bacterium]|jgi:hypothetical protein|nr:hypothetical protein [Dehalococcoidia bacterium]|tara:strand:- start:564 stop:797 length:234 start_codon:yes stop_codon:yes gene_type:complete
MGSFVEINLINENPKDQLEKANAIVKNFAEEDKKILLTKNEMLVKIIPLIAIKKQIKIKIKIVEDIWNITLEGRNYV